ncbi:hypothetical protein LA080_012112 [Diaporthe eres]|nr:hypothetical protein LA080_012112 [Diaporthe eres]
MCWVPKPLLHKETVAKIKARQQCFMLPLKEQARITISKSQVVANAVEKQASISLRSIVFKAGGTASPRRRWGGMNDGFWRTAVPRKHAETRWGCGAMVSASDSSPEGCLFDSGQPHEYFCSSFVCYCFVGGGNKRAIQAAFLPDATWECVRHAKAPSCPSFNLEPERPAGLGDSRISIALVTSNKGPLYKPARETVLLATLLERLHPLCPSPPAFGTYSPPDSHPAHRLTVLIISSQPKKALWAASDQAVPPGNKACMLSKRRKPYTK